MTLTELKYIVTLAEEKHFGKAAEKCNVSQPTLSVAVKKLEDELGVALFERGKNQISVTETGQKVVAQSCKVLQQVEGIQDIVLAGKDPLATPLKLGAIYTVGPYLFPHLVPELRRVAKKLSLYVEENYTSVLKDRLKQGKLDAIVVALPFSEPEVLTLPLYDEPFVVMLPSGHPLINNESLTADDLLSDNLLMLGPGHCFREQLLDSCPQIEKALSSTRTDGAHWPVSNGKPELITEGSSLETIKQMVATGFGISVLPLSAASPPTGMGDLVELRPFRPPVPYRTVAIAWRVTFPRTKAIDTLVLAAGQCRVV
ncbi:MAG: LysR family transcriptional regulator [Proteobacteria bacterium]|nr:MAG: LysR family transcriptional regulator [Pseudomonadota bacterium]